MTPISKVLFIVCRELCLLWIERKHIPEKPSMLTYRKNLHIRIFKKTYIMETFFYFNKISVYNTYY